MRFQCPECKAINVIEDDRHGQDVQCKTCGKDIKVPADSFAPGAVIGDFAIVKEIAKGGMGIVYLAQQLSLDRPAALKIIQPHLCSDKTLVDNLIQEARLAAKLNHPNIVQAYAVGNDNDIIYFAMEYVDGPTMKAVLAEEKVLDFKRAANIASQIADALHFAWSERKLTHRDIKPDNIIIASNGRAKLADLGLSQIGTKSNVTDTGEVLGTPQYISPEQLTGAEIDCRSDIYSLGATLFQFVTGRYAYVGENTDEIAKQHVTGNLTPPKEINPDIPGVLNDIIVKMMALYPANRYQNAKEVRMALDKYIAIADTLSAAAAPGNAGAPAISIIKLDTKKSTAEKKNPNAEQGSAAPAPKAAAAKAVPKAAVPKAGGIKPAAKPALPKNEEKSTAKPDAVAVVKGIAPKALTEKAAAKKNPLLFVVLIAVFVVVVGGAVCFGLFSNSSEETVVTPEIKYAPFAVQARDLIEMMTEIPSADFLNRCDDYFLTTKVPEDAQPHDLAAYLQLRDLYAAMDEPRNAQTRFDLLNGRKERAKNIRKAREEKRLAEEANKRIRAENQKEMEARQREQEKISAAYMKELKAEMEKAKMSFFAAIAESDPSIFIDDTRGMALLDPDYSLLTPEDAKTARPMFEQAQKMQAGLDENIADINRFSIAKDYIVGVQFPWKVINNGKETEFLFHIDDFDIEKLYITDLFTDTEHSLEFASMSPKALQSIDAAIDRKALARKSKQENVVFPTDYQRQHFLFFYFMSKKQYASWMEEIAPNSVWVEILKGIINYKESK